MSPICWYLFRACLPFFLLKSCKGDISAGAVGICGCPHKHLTITRSADVSSVQEPT